MWIKLLGICLVCVSCAGIGGGEALRLIGRRRFLEEVKRIAAGLRGKLRPQLRLHYCSRHPWKPPPTQRPSPLPAHKAGDRPPDDPGTRHWKGWMS